ncbi:MAG: hypothetical protein ACP6KW_11215 [Candidatus Thorarchaeota archaeon]
MAGLAVIHIGTTAAVEKRSARLSFRIHDESGFPFFGAKYGKTIRKSVTWADGGYAERNDQR